MSSDHPNRFGGWVRGHRKVASAFSGGGTIGPRRTFVYVDGFNLYYGALKGSPYRWLDLRALCSLLLPPAKNDVKKIKYFTARVSATPAKPQTAVHQDIYLRALKTLPEVEIHFGHFLTHEVAMPLANVPPGERPRIATAYRVVGGNRWAWVRRTEEKGSDVNLASHLIFDACLNLFEVAVVISNDSDLLEPIKRIRSSLGKVVGILNPQAHPSVVLAKASDFIKPIRSTVLGSAQFAPTLTDATGSFTKPAGW